MAEENYVGQSGPCVDCGETVTVAGKPQTFLGLTIGEFGIVVSIVFVLSCLAVPAVMRGGDPRGDSRRTDCANRLRQIGLALHNYHDIHGRFPPAVVTDENGRPMHSWRVYLLPYLEQEDLYRQYRFDEPWDGPHNAQLLNQCPDIYRCPNDFPHAGGCSYRVVMGENTPWQENKSFQISDITDGTSNTIAIVEVCDAKRNWLEPVEIDGEQIRNFGGTEMRGIDSNHPGGAHVLMMDGSTKFLLKSIDTAELGRLIHHADGEAVYWEY